MTTTEIASRGELLKIPERRAFATQLEVRKSSGTDRVTLAGYASVFDEPYTMYDFFGPYTEVTRHGAFKKTLSEGPDTAFLANHDGLTMARTVSGTLRLAEDDHGLNIEAECNPVRHDVRDLVTAIEDGDISQMSFAFIIIRQEWSPDYEQRDLVELSLDRGDVSAVNFGASPFTEIDAVRAFRHMKPSRIAAIESELRSSALESRTTELLSKLLRAIAAGEDHRPIVGELVAGRGLDGPAHVGPEFAYLLKLRMQLEDGV